MKFVILNYSPFAKGVRGIDFYKPWILFSPQITQFSMSWMPRLIMVGVHQPHWYYELGYSKYRKMDNLISNGIHAVVNRYNSIWL